MVCLHQLSHPPALPTRRDETGGVEAAPRGRVPAPNILCITRLRLNPPTWISCRFRMLPCPRRWVLPHAANSDIRLLLFFLTVPVAPPFCVFSGM